MCSSFRAGVVLGVCVIIYYILYYILLYYYYIILLLYLILYSSSLLFSPNLSSPLLPPLSFPNLIIYLLPFRPYPSIGKESLFKLRRGIFLFHLPFPPIYFSILQCLFKLHSHSKYTCRVFHILIYILSFFQSNYPAFSINQVIILNSCKSKISKTNFKSQYSKPYLYLFILYVSGLT